MAKKASEKMTEERRARLQSVSTTVFTVASTVLLPLRRFPFCRPYYQQLADRLFGFTA